MSVKIEGVKRIFNNFAKVLLRTSFVIFSIFGKTRLNRHVTTSAHHRSHRERETERDRERDTEREILSAKIYSILKRHCDQ